MALPGLGPFASVATAATTTVSTTSLAEDLSKKIRKPYTITKSRESWTEPEHARQKEMATHSVTELVQAMRRPRSHSESTNCLFRKSGGDGRGEEVIEVLARRNSESLPRRNSENVAPPRRNSLGDAKISMQCINEVPEKKQKKSRRRSFMGVIRKSHTQSQTDDDTFDNFGDSEDVRDDSDNDEGPMSLEDKARKKEMRKGMDLATTLGLIQQL